MKLGFLTILSILSYQVYNYYHKYYEDNKQKVKDISDQAELRLKENFKVLLKQQVSKHVWFSEKIVEETAIALSQLCDKPSIQSKTAFGLGKVLRLKAVETNSFRLSKQFLRTNLIYKEDIIMKSKRLAINLIKRADTLQLVNDVATGYFKSDGGVKAFVANLANAQLSPAVMNSYTKAVKKSCYDNLENKENIGNIRSQINKQVNG